MRRAVKPIFKLAVQRIPELALHQQIADAFRKEIAPPGRVSRDGVLWFSVDIAAYSGVAPGLRTTRGIIAGVPDVYLLYKGLSFFIEVKAADGLLSEAQQGMAASILWAGGRYGVARDAAEALECLDAWQIPRAHRLRIL